MYISEIYSICIHIMLHLYIHLVGAWFHHDSTMGCGAATARLRSDWSHWRRTPEDIISLKMLYPQYMDNS